MEAGVLNARLPQVIVSGGRGKMKNSHSKRSSYRLAIFPIFLFALAALSSARAPVTTSVNPVTTSVNIVNNSSREIRSVYLSHVNADDWSDNQLGNGAVIAAGQSYSLSNVACDQQQVKLIGEDQDGCFLSTTVSCGESATWTVTNDTARDCGGS
jgi:hypothetical protein